MWLELVLLGIGIYFLYGKSSGQGHSQQKPRASQVDMPPPPERDVTNSLSGPGPSSNSRGH